MTQPVWVSSIAAGTWPTQNAASSITVNGVAPGVCGGPSVLCQENIHNDGRVYSWAQFPITVLSTNVAPGALPSGVTISANQITTGTTAGWFNSSSSITAGAGFYGDGSHLSGLTDFGPSTAALAVRLTAVAASTTALSASTASLAGVVSALGVSTATLSASTATIAGWVNSTGTALTAEVARATLRENYLGLSTAALAAQFVTNAASMTNISAGGVLVTSSVTAGAYFGDGSHLTGIGGFSGGVASYIPRYTNATTLVPGQFNETASSATYLGAALGTTYGFSAASATFSGLVTGGSFSGVSYATEAVNASLTGAGTVASPLGVNPSSGTLQGNSFNTASRLVQLTAAGKYPALNGSLITGISGVVAGGTANYLTSWTGPTILSVSHFYETASSDTALGAAGLGVLYGLTAGTASFTTSATIPGGSFTVGGTTLVVTGGMVGIGTATPAYGLEITTGTGAHIGKTATTGLFVSTGSRVGIGTSSPSAIFSVGSTNGLQVDSTGNLGFVKGVAYTWPSAQGSASTVLTNDGSGTLTWSAQAGDVTGSGTTGYVTEWTGANTVGTGAIFDNGSVGIGTATPATALDVVGAVNATSSGTFSAVFGDGSHLTGIAGAITGGVANVIPRYSNATTLVPGNFSDTASSDTANGSGGLGVKYGLTAATATITGQETVGSTLTVQGADGSGRSIYAYGSIMSTASTSFIAYPFGGVGSKADIYIGQGATGDDLKIGTFRQSNSSYAGLEILASSVTILSNLDATGEITGSTGSFTGNAFSVGGSSFVVAGGSATVAYSLTATTFIGDGSLLTGVSAGVPAEIAVSTIDATVSTPYGGVNFSTAIFFNGQDHSNDLAQVAIGLNANNEAEVQIGTNTLWQQEDGAALRVNGSSWFTGSSSFDNGSLTTDGGGSLSVQGLNVVTNGISLDTGYIVINDVGLVLNYPGTGFSAFGPGAVLPPVAMVQIDGNLEVGGDYNVNSGNVAMPPNGAIIEGVVGIGTPAPINFLDVAGGVAIGGDYVGVSTAPANGLLVEGGVGIGTTTASGYALQVIGGDVNFSGSAWFGSNTGAGSVVIGPQSLAPGNSLDVNGSVGIGYYAGVPATGNIQLLVGGAVAIGTTNPVTGSNLVVDAGGVTIITPYLLYVGLALTTHSCGAGVTTCTATCPAGNYATGCGIPSVAAVSGLSVATGGSSTATSCTATALTATTITAYVYCARIQ